MVRPQFLHPLDLFNFSLTNPTYLIDVPRTVLIKGLSGFHLLLNSRSQTSYCKCRENNHLFISVSTFLKSLLLYF